MKALVAGVAVVFALAACSSVGMINASDSETRRACSALSRVGYDYWRLDPVAVGGRTMEVAAASHTDHSGPRATRDYCRGRSGPESLRNVL